MVDISTHTMSLSPAALMEALYRAFAYPWNGIEETIAPLRAFAAQEESARWSSLLEEALGRSEEFEDRTAEQLAYTRLFIGSFKMEAPPYASYYLEEAHTLNGQVAAEVESVYAQFGLELDSKEIAPPDHLRYLMAFMSLLAGRYEETGEGAFAEAYVEFRDEFVLTWIDDFQALVNKYAEQPYYPALIELIVKVLKSDEAHADASEGE